MAQKKLEFLGVKAFLRDGDAEEEEGLSPTSTIAAPRVARMSSKLGLLSGLASQQSRSRLASTGDKFLAIVGRKPFPTTSVMNSSLATPLKGSLPVIISQSMIPKLYTSTFWL